MNKTIQLFAVILLCIFTMATTGYAENEAETNTIETITIENSEEFSEVYYTKNEYADIVKTFAKAHKGDLIEFDGHVANIARHGSFKTRFDYLIICGPYRETGLYGPMFQFVDVNYYDLHLTGENKPDSVTMGMNLHIIAEVVEYKEMSGLFIIEPVSIEVITAD